MACRHHPLVTVDTERIVTLVVLKLSSPAKKIDCGLNNFDVTVLT